MELTARLRRQLGRWAARRPHVLVVTSPGGTAARLAIQAALRSMNGTPAMSPAEADLLVVAGSPGPELSAVFDEVWAQVPQPRARVTVTDPRDCPAQLADAVAELARIDRATESTALPAESSANADHGDLGGHDGGDMGGMSGDDMGGMEMPGGLAMADRAVDRDGLRLDVLHVPLGPVLPDWPAGLVIGVELQGDVIQAARQRLLPARVPAAPYWSGKARADEFLRVAAHLDSLARLLAVCGWAGAAAEAAVLGAAVLADPVASHHRSSFDHFSRRVERSRSLRLATAGLGRLSTGDVARLELSGPAARAVAGGGGDAAARCRTWLVEIDRALAGQLVAPGQGPRGDRATGSSAVLAAAVELMAGLDLAGARIVLASLDPDTDELAALGALVDPAVPDTMRGAS